MSLLVAAIAAQAQLVTAAPGHALPVPATSWSCTFEVPEGTRFRLSGRIDEIPAGWDPNASRPTRVEGEGPDALAGTLAMTGSMAGEFFREYQLTSQQGRERYSINLRLRRGGAGVADITRYVENEDRQPYTYFAAGLCTSNFDGAAAPQGTQP